MAVDVVVVNYKTPDLLENFKKSYFNNAWDGCTLTVVDVEVGEDSWSRGQRLLRTKDNIGYARACNLGASFGRNDVILLANADTELSDGFRECYEALVQNDDWGVLGPRQVNEHNQLTAGGIYGTNRAKRQYHWNEPDQGQASQIEEAVTVSGSLYFIKRKVWDLLTECVFYQSLFEDNEKPTGAFLPTQHYFEETWCSEHAREHGFKVIFYGPVKMLHLWHRAHPHNSWQDKEFGRSLTLYREAALAHGMEHE